MTEVNKENESAQITRRRLFGNAASVAATAVLPAAIVGESIRRLDLSYPEVPKVEQGVVVEKQIGPKLKVRFLPLEHTRADGLVNLERHKKAIEETLLAADVGEVWLEAYPEEMRKLSNALPAEIRNEADTVLDFVTHKKALERFFQPLVDLVASRTSRGKTPADIVIPDLVGGSSTFALVSDKVLGLRGPAADVIAGVAVFDTLADSDKDINDSGDITRRGLLKRFARGAVSGLWGANSISSLFHFQQIFGNRGYANYATEDTVRDAWVAWQMQEFSRQLEADENAPARTIACVYTPPHIEGILKRFEDPNELNREMSTYMSMTPKSLWHEGTRRYTPDANGDYSQVDFSFATAIDNFAVNSTSSPNSS